jgi:hypothetical protein
MTKITWAGDFPCHAAYLQVSDGGHHGHVTHLASTAPRRHPGDEASRVRIRAVHAQTRHACGWPRP